MSNANPRFIVRYAGAAVKFHDEPGREIFELVMEDDATVFPTRAAANEARIKHRLRHGSVDTLS